MTDRFRVVPAAYLLLRRLVDGRDEVLLQLRTGTGYRDGYWAAGAAGHVERGESVFGAARREAAEELGIAVELADLVPLTTMHRTHPDHAPVDERVDVFFACDQWTGQPAIREPAKSAALAWSPLTALPTPVVPHELLVLEGLRLGDLPPLLAVGFEEADVQLSRATAAPS